MSQQSADNTQASPSIAATIENSLLSLSVDGRGRIVRLENRATQTELINYPEAAEAWRMVLPSGRHTVDFVYGSQQTPASIEVLRAAGKQSIVIAYDTINTGNGPIPLAARFTLTLDERAGLFTAQVALDNRSERTIDEVEFPVIGGLGGFVDRGKRLMNLVAAGDCGRFYDDVLNQGLPNTGRESDQFVREHETAMFEPDTVEGGGYAGAHKRGWLDLWSTQQGLYFAYLGNDARDFAFKIERYPKGVPNAPAHYYPAGTPHWLRVWALHVPRLGAHAAWTSEPVTIMPHKGDWHAGADHYSAYRHSELAMAAPPPQWMENFVGWTEILGKTYLGEIFHDYPRCASEVIRDKEVTGLDFVFYYGHSILGAEGADFDHSPSPDLGGEVEFRKMVDTLHAQGCRIMLLDHFHTCVNRDVPEYQALGLERYAVLDEEGKPRTARWWKETFLSCRRLAGPTPIWVLMCPACPEWQDIFLRHVEQMIALGVDGLELDCFTPVPCYNPAHNHPPGAHLMDAKIAFMRRVRDHAKRLNPDFVLFAETMEPVVRSIADGYYSFRYPDEHGRIYRYLFPENIQQTVRVGNYAYDAVNRAVSLGIGVNTEIWGLRKTALAGCPEFARYIGEVNRFRRKYADILIHGTFRDTLGAEVAGDVLYSVLENANGQAALVLRNPHPQRRRARGSLAHVRPGQRFILWRPFREEERLESPAASVVLGPYGLAVLLAL